MNPSYGKSGNRTGSINAFDFDLGMGSGRGKPLNDQKSQTSPYSSMPSWTPQTNKPAWTHKPASPVQMGGLGSLSGPTSMVGDISGKSRNSSGPQNSSLSGIGIVNSNDANLFGDLLGSAMGQNKSTSNVPLKNAAPAANLNRFSMGSMSDSLPKTGNPAQNMGTWGSNAGNFGGVKSSGVSYNNTSSVSGGNVNLGGIGNRNPNLGGPSLKSMTGSGVGEGRVGSNKDPFGSLVDFRSKPLGGMKSASKVSNSNGLRSDSFGEFQSNSSKASGSNSPFSSGASPPSDNSFREFQNHTSKKSGSTSAFPSGVSPASNNNPLGDFGFSSSQPNIQSQPSLQSSGANDFDALFSSTAGGGTSRTEGSMSQQFLSDDDWGINSEFGEVNDTGGTTELDGLPLPPRGVSAPDAKSKGLGNYKQGQFADAIKWLSWAEVLLEKAGDTDGTMEVLTCRASCYKEVGEYKKAVADCTKVLGRDSNNVSALVQRALLYESMEKYKLGAEDLRMVMKLDPGNRVARSTIHRLIKMAG